jgi:hypothetical protein
MNARPANALLNFDRAERLSSISIIDWEFVTIGPTFLDISNLVAELFFLGYTTRNDLTYAEVLDSFINTYRAFGGSLCLRRTIAVVGAAILDLVVRRMDLNGSQETMAMATECVKLALNFIFDAESTDFTLAENDPFAMLSRILRDCLRTRNGKST